MEIIQKQL